MKSKLFALLKAEPSIEKRVLHGMPCPLLAQSGHRQRTSTAHVCFLTESGHRLELKHFIIDGPSFWGLVHAQVGITGGAWSVDRNVPGFN
jgi:hypothetical protein